MAVDGPLRIIHCFRSPIGGIFRHVRDLAEFHDQAGPDLCFICDSLTGSAFEDTLFDEIRTGPPISDGRDTDTKEQRARAYLAVNCGICHRGDGPASGLGDYRLEMKFGSMQVCNARVQNGDINSLRLVPGKPEESAIIQRMKAHDGTRMPPLATNVVDERGVKWVSDWIASIPPSTCPRPSPLGP